MTLRDYSGDRSGTYIHLKQSTAPKAHQQFRLLSGRTQTNAINTAASIQHQRTTDTQRSDTQRHFQLKDSVEIDDII